MLYLIKRMLYIYSIFLQNNGKVFYALDANFGLVLKKAASKSLKSPIRSNMFVPDEDVREFIDKYEDINKQDAEVCFDIGITSQIKMNRTQLC